jgi:hypothetical protein
LSDGCSRDGSRACVGQRKMGMRGMMGDEGDNRIGKGR